MSARRALRAGGLWFDGKDDYIRIAHSPSLDITSAITIAAWVYPSSLPSPFPRIVSKETETSVNSYNLLIDASPRRYSFHAGGASRVSGGTVTLHAWQHVAVTWDSVSQLPRLYVNGSLVATGTAYSGPIPSTTYDVLIGNNPTNVRQFHGIIDDVRVYNRALSADEIRAIYERGALIRDGLVLLLDFSEYEGNVAYDKSGCGNHATIYGARWVIKKQLRTLPETR